jgi:hypothetical protein
MHAYTLVVAAVGVAYIVTSIVSFLTGILMFTLLVGSVLALALCGLPNPTLKPMQFLSCAVPGTSGVPIDDHGEVPPRSALEQSILLQKLPPWVAHPDAIKSEWFNDILELLWPTLRPSIEGSIASAVNSAAVGTAVQLVSCSLGDQPPAVTAIKCYTQTIRGSSVLLDFSIEVGGNIGAVVNIKAGPMSIPVVLSDVFSQFDVRVELGPPVAEVPPIAGIKVTSCTHSVEFMRCCSTSPPPSFFSGITCST